MAASIRSVGRTLTGTPRAIRWLGFVGAVLLGLSAYVGGAFPTLDLKANPVEIFERPQGPLIYLLFVTGTAGLCVAWWCGLRHVGRGVLTTRWVLATAALWSLPMLVIPPIGSRDVYAYACQGAVVSAGQSPYVEGVSALPCQWLDSVSVIWRNTPAPYGPLFLVIAGWVAAIGSLTAAIIVFRLIAVAGVGLIAATLPRLARSVGVPVDRALWLVLACPLVVEHLVGGAHNDAMTIGLLVAGMAVLASPSRRAWALVVGGALIGLAIAVKPVVGVTLPFAALVATDAPPLPEMRLLLRRGAAIFASALGTLAAVSFGSGLGFGWIAALSGMGDSVVWTSPPTALGLAIGYVGRIFGLHLHAEVTTRLIAVIVLPIVLLFIVWHTRRQSPFFGAGLALLATIFLSVNVQPWYLLWPLAMFAVTRMRMRWFINAVLIASCIVLPDGSGFTKIIQAPASFLMTGIVVWVCIRSLTWARGFEPEEMTFEPAVPDTA